MADKRMTRREITRHAAAVARTYLGDVGGVKPLEDVLVYRLSSMIELAMCRAAGIKWENKR